MSLTVVSSRRFADHLMPPGHPERVERALVMQALAAEFAATGGSVLEPRPVTDLELTRVHEAGYLERLRAVSGRAVALDGDTFTSPESVNVARLAVGAGLTAVDAVLAPGGSPRALALVRPPGHHAERDRAMGFCLLNTAAVAAAHARASGVERVAIVDYDVHHGNGSQQAFYDDPSVLFVSSHQFPFYPGTGAATEVGSGAGRGFTVNLPMTAGADDADFDLVYREAVLPALQAFRPQLVVVSAGFDAHQDDPLGGMRVTTPQFGRLTAMLMEAAEASEEGRLVAVLEGGYDLDALRASLREVITVMAGERNLRDYQMPSGAAVRGRAALAARDAAARGSGTL